MAASQPYRSEEHTSELQSPQNLVCRLLLEKKKQYHGAMIAKKEQTSAHIAPEALELSFSSENIGAQFLRAQNYVASFAHREIAAERNHVGGNIDQQNATETDVVVHESDEGAGDEPSSLNAGQKKRVGLHELALGREFLNQRGDGWPEHPETGGDEGVHQVELPHLHPMLEREDGDGHDDQGADGVEPHDQAAAIFAINDYASEGKHEHGGNGLQNGEGTERHFRVGGFQNVPGNRGRIHPAAQHGDHVGGKDKAQRALAEDVSHTLL